MPLYLPASSADNWEGSDGRALPWYKRELLLFYEKAKVGGS